MRPGRRLSFRWLGGSLEGKGNSVGDALAVTTTADADHLAAAIGLDPTERPNDLAYLDRREDRHFLTKTSSAKELARVVNEELGDAIDMVHASDRRDQPWGRQRRSMSSRTPRSRATCATGTPPGWRVVPLQP